jgi:signal peptidase II
MNKGKIQIITIVFLTLLLDIITKMIVCKFMKIGSSIEIVKNFIYITYVRNTGIAFSFLTGGRYIIIIITLIILYYLWHYLETKKISKLESICYGMIIGGAVGNLLDRLIYGYVIDFIDIIIFGYNYPVFNIADCFIVIGIIIILFRSFIKERSDKDGFDSR